MFPYGLIEEFSRGTAASCRGMMGGHSSWQGPDTIKVVPCGAVLVIVQVVRSQGVSAIRDEMGQLEGLLRTDCVIQTDQL